MPWAVPATATPSPSFSPCHRVYRQAHRLRLYGVEMKQYLLELNSRSNFMIGMSPRFALCIFAAENLFYICVSEKPAGFSKQFFFIVGSLWETVSYY